MIGTVANPVPALRTYPAPWKGHLILVCRKCQKKLKPNHELAKLSKVLKRFAKHHPEAPRLRILKVPCLNLCPKRAVTVCTQSQLAQGTCSILRTRADLDALILQCRSEST